MHLDANFSTVPIVFENVGVPKGVVEFISLRDSATDSDSMEIGGSVIRKGGVLFVDIFTEQGQGTQRSRVLADELAVLLENQQVGDVTLNEAELHTVGKLADANYFQQVLQIPYSIMYGQEQTACQV